MSVKKRALQIGLFLAIMFLTFYALFSGRDIAEIGRAVMRMSLWYLVPAVMLAVFFVCAEGYMIWYLLRSMKSHKEGYKPSSLFRCIQYSFIGFFYSGITPSATGGQPVQLYYMNKDGNRGSDSTVVLMTVALAYKFVLVILGLGILLFWMNPLRGELGKFFPLYLLGLALNVLLVILILGVMLFPQVILRAAIMFEGLFIRLKIWKPSEKREEKIQAFIDSYQQAVTWLKGHKGSLAVVVFVTFLQRCSVFVLTYMVYLGFGLHGAGAMKVILLQAAVYIAVDMLPLPGAQGITELMYQAVFVHVFTGAYLIPSMLVSRGINFYFLLLVSLAVVLINRFVLDRRKRIKAARA
ncbi:MAG TPA: flippase-like domain-containing protein [Candidatus Mediterraneibacter colneyensis]|nr:flippase-like domain-containing protein [Candidatus Mediterraneibacter colneyensis]